MGQVNYSEPVSFEDMEQREEATKEVESTEAEKAEQE
jgi:hypothetical protein